MDEYGRGAWLERAWSLLDERSRLMFAEREEGRTLEEIGQVHGVTRERVRQILLKAEQHLLVTADLMAPDWREHLTELATRPAVTTENLTDVLGVDGHVTIGAYARAAGYVHPRVWGCDLNGWWAAGSGDLERRLREIAERAPLRAGELSGFAEAAGVPEGVPLESLFGGERSPLVQGEDGSWLRRRARGRDACYLWLLQRGEPCRAEELANATGVSTAHAVREALRRDDRFVQVRPEGTWALVEWSLPEVTPYANAVEALVAVVTESGPISKDTLFSRVVERYPVTAWRMQQCLLSDQIGTTADGLIDLVERGAVPNEESEPPKPDTMAVDPQGKVYGIRLKVDKDVLRGSGILVSSWITWSLGLRRAPMSRTFALPGDAGPLILRRGTSGAQISSLRLYAQAQRMVIGCDIAVLLRADDSTADVRHACEEGNCPARYPDHRPVG
ncbi:sigma factor-like helix-turn-helix DNA-binding protein [Streptomyces virginiae]|uniref:sigma factor-like helix-turn-helix DNA-binding protein n=1 Tax=Streptomyces virginiae TaxID=1961 RepID=UPI00368CC086